MTTNQLEPTRRVTADALLIDLAEARRLLGGLGRTRLFQLIGEGRLQRLKIGTRTFLRREDVIAFVETLATTGDEGVS